MRHSQLTPKTAMFSLIAKTVLPQGRWQQRTYPQYIDSQPPHELLMSELDDRPATRARFTGAPVCVSPAI